MTSWNELNFDQKAEVKQDLIKWLYRQRLTSKGYAYSDYKVMSTLASNLRRRVRYHGISLVNKTSILDNLIVDPVDGFGILFDTKFNETFVGILIALSNTK